MSNNGDLSPLELEFNGGVSHQKPSPYCPQATAAPPTFPFAFLCIPLVFLCPLLAFPHLSLEFLQCLLGFLMPCFHVPLVFLLPSLLPLPLLSLHILPSLLDLQQAHEHIIQPLHPRSPLSSPWHGVPFPLLFSLSVTFPLPSCTLQGSAQPNC